MLFRVIALFVAIIGGPLVAQAKRVAFVVGQSAYEHLEVLSSPTRDAARLAQILQQYEFEVASCDGGSQGCFNLRHSDFSVALDQFEMRARGADVALVFFAGHGMNVAGRNLIAPIDMSLDCSGAAAENDIALQKLIDAASGAANSIIILDASRHNPLTPWPVR